MNTKPEPDHTIPRRPLRRLSRLAAVGVALTVVVAACGDSSNDDPTAAEITSTSVEPATTSVSTTPAPTTAVPTTAAPTTAAAPTTTSPPSLVVDGDVVTIDWSALEADPFYATPVDGGDPLFHIHTTPAVDGFFLSLEMYTTGYGQGWTGETGTFDISCDNPTSSTGICPYFDADGPGPEPVKGSDFMTTGSLTIVQLDDGGYEIVVHELVFSDGTTFDEFTIAG